MSFDPSTLLVYFEAPQILRQLGAASLWLYLLLPSLLCDNLLCFYSPILLEEEKSEFKPILTECPPEQQCFKADGRYGNYSALSARGCMAANNCSQVHDFHFKGTVYNMTYACCDKPYCNSCPGVTARFLCLVLTLISLAACK
ncbi:protein Bouncer [Genypterus blacodes]|uniref:protein Bouncer n=1 Tax=Genypterus blacodes TaxID=154954 RepID=UPI003F76A59E